MYIHYMLTHLEFFMVVISHHAITPSCCCVEQLILGALVREKEIAVTSLCLVSVGVDLLWSVVVLAHHARKGSCLSASCTCPRACVLERKQTFFCTVKTRHEFPQCPAATWSAPSRVTATTSADGSWNTGSTADRSRLVY